MTASIAGNPRASCGRSTGIARSDTPAPSTGSGAFAFNGVVPRFDGASEQRDAGLLGITTKHLYFKGSHTSFRVRLEKIVSFEPFRDGLQIMRDTARAKPEVFTMETTDVWFAVNLINALVGIEDVALPGRDAPTLDDIVNEVPDEKV